MTGEEAPEKVTPEKITTLVMTALVLQRDRKAVGTASARISNTPMGGG